MISTFIKTPAAIMKTQGDFENTETLLKKKTRQIGLAERDCMSVAGQGYLLLDYGEELCGGIEISTFTVAENAYVKIRIRFGESVSEANSTLFVKNSSNDHSLRDFETTLVPYSTMRFGRTGFRFVRIDFCDEIALRIKAINAVHTMHTLSPQYVYGGTDTTVAEIFSVAKHTIDLCMQEYVWDGIKRDRLVWIGDMHPEMLAICTLYGRQKIVERSLDFVREQTPLPGWMNGIPMYSLWWIIILADYHRLTGCSDYLRAQAEYLQALISQIDACVGLDGVLNFPKYFIDWPTRGKTDELLGVRALAIWAMKSAADIMHILHMDFSVAEAVLTRLKKQSKEIVEAKQVIGLKYMANGAISDNDKKLLVRDGAKGISTFMSYYILKAVADTIDLETAVNMMKEYYGGMLSRGATTFWEDFDIDWLQGSGRIDAIPKPDEKDLHGDYGDYCYKGFRHSLCHGWSTGVIRFIKEYLDV